MLYTEFLKSKGLTALSFFPCFNHKTTLKASVDGCVVFMDSAISKKKPVYVQETGVNLYRLTNDKPVMF